MPVDGASIEDLNPGSIQSFVDKALGKDRISSDAKSSSFELLLQNLNLLIDNRLTNAALLLFGKHPAKVSVTASFKIGRFGKSSENLLFQDIIETNLFEMPDKVMEVLQAKYLIRPISYQGLERVESLEYPEAALREAILNAIIHKDYSSTYILMRVYEDRLYLWNPGKLPDELSIEQLKREHSSYPRNRNMANTFFKAGYIESWGRGTNKIITATIEAGLPEPLIQEEQGGVSITFFKDIYTQEYLPKLGINDRQIKAVLYAKTKGQVTNSEYQYINKIGKSVAATELQDLTDRAILVRVGTTGRGTKYLLKTQKS
jgi:ATP-dependent DNA helicase RecG